MLEFLHLEHLGPAPKLELNLAPRLNLIAGDNGLGKTLLLDAAWWAQAQTWPLTWSGGGLVPEKEGASITWAERQGVIHESRYSFDDALWRREKERVPPLQAVREHGLVVYLRVDGGISIHDPLRIGEDFRLTGGRRSIGVSSSFQFQEQDLWNGLTLRHTGRLVCEGLVRDVGRWALEQESQEFEQLTRLVEQLAGDERFRLTRKTQRVYIDDARDFPVIAGPSGEFPVAHAPAGLRRILGLAYLVVWAWREHKIAANLKKRDPSPSLVLLIDEVESHLHPKWQRRILPSILRALNHEVQLQVVATTHSPMVLASVEPVFDLELDKLFVLELEEQVVTLHEQPWAIQGDVINWLVSDTFGLKQARSSEAERAIEAAEAWMRGESAALPADLSTKEAIHAELQRLLAGHDPFWPRWVVTYEKADPPSSCGRRRLPSRCSGSGLSNTLGSGSE